jgi:hypothetical protein
MPAANTVNQTSIQVRPPMSAHRCPPTDPVPSAEKIVIRNRVLFRSQGTGVVEDWAMAPGALLRFQRPHPTAPGTTHDRLVFQRAERRVLVLQSLQKRKGRPPALLTQRNRPMCR